MITEPTTFDQSLVALEPFSRQLRDFIDIERHFVSGSLVVALSSKYGSGKSTFFRMWVSQLTSSEGEAPPPVVVKLNAWESDYYGEPLFAIVSSLVEQIGIGDDTANAVKEAAKDLGWFFTSIATQAAKNISGIDPVAAGREATKKKLQRANKVQIPEDAFTAFQKRKEAMINLKRELSIFIEKKKPYVLFLVDELDRCRPDYAINYLETIKHIFDLSGAVFVLAADRGQLKNSAMVAFGSELDFDEYYRKFVHREISLPSLRKPDYRKIAEAYTNFFLDRSEHRGSCAKIDAETEDQIQTFISGLKLTPRQCQEMFRILGHLFSTRNRNSGTASDLLMTISIAIAAMKVGRGDLFHRFGNRLISPKEGAEVLDSIVGTKRIDWWILAFAAFGAFKMNEGSDLADIFIESGLCKSRADYNQNYPYTRIDEGGLSELYFKILEISKWVHD